MSETDPGFTEQHAGDVGARRATVGMPTDHESVNVPPTRPGAAENARRAEAGREEHGTFVPEPPLRDEETEGVETREGEVRPRTGSRPAREHDKVPPRPETGAGDK